MNILLIGEYNSSHYGLKLALQQLGHKVTVIGHGDVSLVSHVFGVCPGNINHYSLQI